MGEFELHKLTHETLGEYLTSVRQDFGHTRAQVSQQTGVSLKLLVALEDGNFSQLPELVYVVGFVKKLAELYATAEDPLILQLYREAALAKRQDVVAGRSWKTLMARISPTRWALLASVGGGLVFLAVCLFQVLAIGRVPELTVSEPREDQHVDGGLVRVSGFATPGSEVSLNGQPVFAGSDGTFSSSMSVLSGSQVLTVSAKSRFGKMATRHINFVASHEMEVSHVPLLPTGLLRSNEVAAVAERTVVR